ncbi:Phage major capsid protein |uniref:major capsid protein n=1 Tax=Alloactinosynnema sp. L-07 TaxID=1653480 RepID=UPI00065F0ACE|nr:major capsid protein [Alloactinosynnema sp. L-07]CRK59069.1 Phage major capsid protein \
MIVFDGPVAPDAITTFVREVPTSTAHVLDQLLPNRYFNDNEIDFEELTRTNRVARFRTYDGRLHVSSRDSGKTSKVKLPPLSTSLSKGEYERLQLEFARTGGTNNAALEQAIYNDSENLTGEVLNRMELARGDVLTDFKFTMMGDAGEPGGLEADYVAPPGHLVAPGTLWSDTTTATVLSNLVAWHDVYVNDNGSGAGFTWTSTKVSRLMQRNKEIIDAVHGATAGRTRVTIGELNALLESEGLPAVRTYDAKVDVDGVTTSIIPDDRLMFTPTEPGSLGYTAWGISATALELVNSNRSELSFEEAPGIVGVVIKEGPPFREFTFVDAVGMPVIANPRALMVADVL